MSDHLNSSPPDSDNCWLLPTVPQKIVVTASEFDAIHNLALEEKYKTTPAWRKAVERARPIETRN